MSGAKKSKKQIDDEVAVFRLALLIEDVDRGERAAMRRTAKRLDRRWNARTVTNEAHLAAHGPIHLVADVEAAYR